MTVERQLVSLVKNTAVLGDIHQQITSVLSLAPFMIPTLVLFALSGFSVITFTHAQTLPRTKLLLYIYRWTDFFSFHSLPLTS